MSKNFTGKVQAPEEAAQALIGAPGATPTVRLDLPPYGCMHEALEAEVAGQPFPAQFRIKGAVPTKEEFFQWIDNLADELATFLWPRYKDGNWAGKAIAHADEMTITDIALLQQLRTNIDLPITARQKTTITHRTLFTFEDTGAPGNRIIDYDNTVPESLVGLMQTSVLKAGGAVSAISLGLKQRIQRPRAYQAALIRGIPYTYLLANTAVTPSMVSGHCLEGSAACCGAYLDLRKQIDAAPGLTPYFQQYMIDIGDRRVFAGVHYPTDNVSSWFCDLRMCENLYGVDAALAKAFLWRAITQRSTVYRALSEAAKSSALYASILSTLEAEALRSPTA